MCGLCDIEHENQGELTAALWHVWIREYGAAGAIRLALSHGITREQILRVNREARDQALQDAGVRL